MQRTTTITMTAILMLAIASIAPAVENPFALTEARNRMVDREVAGAGVKNTRVLEAVRNTPRHEFVPLPLREQAYFDMALPIGESQTISPPFIVAFMTEQLDPQPNDVVLLPGLLSQVHVGHVEEVASFGFFRVRAEAGLLFGIPGPAGLDRLPGADADPRH